MLCDGIFHFSTAFGEKAGLNTETNIICKARSGDLVIASDKLQRVQYLKVHQRDAVLIGKIFRVKLTAMISMCNP